MKKFVFPTLAVLLTLSGVTLSQQSGDPRKGSSMMESMPDMMKSKQSHEGGMHGMGDMDGMMGMMKMMEQCNDMMNAMRRQAEKPKETQKK
jgi:hypothetical protein